MSPALFLFSGLGLSILAGDRFEPAHPFAKRWGTRVLQASVVLLGFKIPFGELLEAGRTGLAASLVSVFLILLTGWMLQRWFRLGREQAILISSGTAICGGSAIAAVAPVVRASGVDIGVSVAVVFLLNALAMVLFPPIGQWAGLDDRQFAFWSALAIHDTSSVVGAAAQWSEDALRWATTIKLSRTLWIFPMVLGLTFLERKKSAQSRVAIPWFIAGFLLASLLGSVVELPLLGSLSRSGFSASLFLIGASVSRRQLGRAALAPMIYGAVLWLLTLVGSLAYLRLSSG